MRQIHTRADVTSLAFSGKYPNLLAVGLYDGTVLIYDIKREVRALPRDGDALPSQQWGAVFSRPRPSCGPQSDKPLLQSVHETGKHTDAVWRLVWVDRGSDKGETLISLSSDGRVCEWSTKKGLTWTGTPLPRPAMPCPMGASPLPLPDRTTPCSELFPLKRRTNEEGVSWRPPNAASDGLIARHARGLALDFPNDEPSVFFVGTEVRAGEIRR